VRDKLESIEQKLPPGYVAPQHIAKIETYADTKLARRS
jgi:hypothetical protein